MTEEKQVTYIPKNRRMQVFFVIWFGQLISLIGSSLTGFALGVWVYQRTGSVTQFALISVSTVLPKILISPFAGAFVDRWNRRRAMLFGDTGSGLVTLAIAILFFVGKLEIWQIYLGTAVSSICSAFQWPAYLAATTQLVPKQHLSRASGLIHVSESIAQLTSPILAGVLVTTIQIQGVFLLDFITFLFALITLLFVKFPEHRTRGDNQEKSSLLKEILQGWIYIKTRPGLLGLTLLVAASNSLAGIVEVLATPLILSFASPAALGTVLSIGGSGMLVGSLLMSTWGGSQHLMRNVFCFMLLSGLSILSVGLKADTSLVALGAFLFFLSLPITNTSIDVIFQKKVVPDIQGRVFALVGMITESSIPVSYLLAGPLADRVFEPLLASNGVLAGNIGQLIGVGRGRGIALMFIVIGALTMALAIIAYQYPRLRLVEKELPDAIADPATKNHHESFSE
jgi:MFS transporter, DHA3 family, macrolide efflux protein